MVRFRLAHLVGLAAFLLSGSSWSADDPAPEALLKDKRLRRVGTSYVLPGEAEFSKKLGAARTLYKGLSNAIIQQEALSQHLAANKELIQQLTQQRIFLN